MNLRLEFLPIRKLNLPGFGFVAFYVNVVETALNPFDFEILISKHFSRRSTIISDVNK